MLKNCNSELHSLNVSYSKIHVQQKNLVGDNMCGTEVDTNLLSTEHAIDTAVREQLKDNTKSIEVNSGQQSVLAEALQAAEEENDNIKSKKRPTFLVPAV